MHHLRSLHLTALALAALLTGCAHQPAAPLAMTLGALDTSGSAGTTTVTFTCNPTCTVAVSQVSIDAGAPADSGGRADAGQPIDSGTADAAVDAGPTDAAVPDAGPPVVDAGSPTQVARPAYSKGVGFYVVGSKLYDPNGNEFRIRGINRVHWDSSSPGIAATHANAQRWIIDFSQPVANNLALMKSQGSDWKMVSIPGNWSATCTEDPAKLAAVVDTWVAQAAAWTSIERTSIINIANEWGPESTVWRDSYITAVQRMRAAGYHATLMIDAGNCGQSPNDIALYGQAIMDADPEHNIVYSEHLYGYAGSAKFPGQKWSAYDIDAELAKLKATGLPIVIGEFGPGQNIGPSPTTIPPLYIAQAAEAAGFGWLPWAADDTAACKGDDTWFAMFKCGVYNSSSDLTTFGRAIIEDPTYGLKALGKPASIF